MDKLDLNFEKTALVLIDLQKGIVTFPGGDQVVENALELIDLFKQQNGFIAYVNVDFHDGNDALKPITDESPASGERTADWAEFDERLPITAEDYTVTKRNWGAFFGTDLDTQLRRRSIERIVLAGIATNYGVESTAREAYHRGYSQIFITDAMVSVSEEAHQATLKYVFPRIGQLRTTAEFLEQIEI